MTITDNTRAVIGDNQSPAYAERITAQMERDYGALTEGITALLDRARDQPKEVATDEQATAMGLVVKELRETDRRAEAYRVAEKEPHKAAGDAVDAFFFGWREKIGRRNPRDRSQKPGAADVLQARIDDYLERKRLEEEGRRRREAEEAARKAREAREAQERAEREAEEARRAAERARKPEQIAAKEAIAEHREGEAAAAAVDAAVAAEQAQGAHIATLATPAEMARTRGDGVLLTQARQPYAIVLDRAKLDKAALWPFFTDAEIEKALRGWAKTTGHHQQMDGAEIGFQRKGVTR